MCELDPWLWVSFESGFRNCLVRDGILLPLLIADAAGANGILP